MPDKSETEQTGGQDVKEQARREIRERIDETNQSSNPEEVKKNLGKELAKRLEEAIEEAKEVVDNEKKAKKGEEVFVKEKEKNQVTTKLIQVFEAVKGNIQVAKTPQAQAFLKKIVEEIPSPSPSQCSQIAAYLTPYLLGEKDIIINPSDQPKSDFQRDFENLVSINRQLADKVKQALSEAVRANPGLYKKLDERTIEEGLPLPKEEDLEEKPLSQKTASFEAQDRYDHLFKKISQGIKAAIEAVIKEGKIPEEKKEKIKDVQTFLYAPVVVSLEKVLPALHEVGISDEEASEYLRLYHELFGKDVTLGTLKTYAGKLAVEIERAEVDFSQKSLIEKGILTYDENKGRYILTREGRLKFQKMIIKYYYKMLAHVHRNRSAHFTEAFRENISYQYYRSAINQIVASACEQLMPFFQDDPSALEFLRDKSARFQVSIMNFAQIFHDIPLMARSDPKSIEKWAGFFNALFPSQLAEVFDEGDERVMEITRSIITTTLRERLALNRNYYPNDLYGGQYVRENVYWQPTLESNLRERLVRRLNALKIEYEDWEIERALTYGLGIGYLTLIDPETLVTAYPEPGNFRGIHPILSVLSAKFNWGLGRGFPYAGLISKYLLSTDITLFPEYRSILRRLWTKKRWVPKEFADMVDRNIKGYGGEVLRLLFEREGSLQELLSIVNFATSLLSRGGWRVGGFWAEAQRRYKDFGYNVWRNWNAEDWINLYDSLLRDYGATALWWSESTGPSRLANELKRLMYAHGIRDDQFDDFFYSTLGTGRRSSERIFKFIDIDGQTRKLSITEIKQKRLYQIRGENFFRYLRRNPGDFFLIFTQMAPEILEEDIFLTKSEYKNKYKKMGQPKTPYEVQQFEARKQQFMARWGEEGVLILKNVREWLINQSKTLGRSEKEFIQLLVAQSGHAFEKLRNRRGDYLTAEDFESLGDEGKKIGRAVFGKGGLIEILTGLTDLSDANLREFYKNFGNYQNAGKPTIFYLLGQNWTLKEGDINPFSSDVNYYSVFKDIGGIGEDVFGRLTGDAAYQFQEVISKLPNLDQLLLTAAKSGSLDEIYKLHTSLFNVVKGTIGLEAAYRANYILAQLVTKFFWEHSLVRDPKLKYLMPFSLLARLTLGKNLSLSKLLTDNIHALSMDTNAARTYFLHLSTELGVIPREGAWSEENLKQVFEATGAEFVFGEVAPNLFWFMIMFLLFNYLKKAIEEAGGKKK